MNKFRKFFEVLGVTVFTVIFCFIVAEMSLRVFLKPKVNEDATVKLEMTDEQICKGETDPYETPNVCYPLYDNIAKMNFSTYFGYVPAPNVSGRGYSTNNATMRYDSPLSDVKQNDERRVFITGGSTAWGAGVPQNQLYSNIAEKFLAGKIRDKTIKVVDAGVGGYVSTHEVLRYQYYIRDLKPDLWVMFTGWNDVYIGYRGRAYVNSPDMFELEHAFALAASSNIYWASKFVINQDRPNPPAWGSYSLKLHWLIEKVRFNISLQRNANSSMQVQKADYIPPSKVVDILIDNISAASYWAKKDGIKLVVMLQPTIYATQKKLSDYEKGIISKAERQYPGLSDFFAQCYELMRKRLSEESHKGSFTYIDTDEAIASEPKSVFVDHVHFGDRGNREIGLFLGDSLQRTEMIP